MKLKYKVLICFFVSIALSVCIFLFSSYYIINKGVYSGISRGDMYTATDNIITSLTSGEFTTTDFDSVTSDYSRMDFELICNSSVIMSTSSDSPEIISNADIINAIQGRSDSASEYEIAAKSFANNDCEYIIVCLVDKKYFDSISYRFNMTRASGVLGNIGLFGMIITFIITGVFYLFLTKKIRKRLYRLYTTIQSYDYNNPSIRVNDLKKDEIGTIAACFDKMAAELESQLSAEKAQEEGRKKLISSLAHDLRTPMSSLVGYSEMLRDGVYDNEEERSEYTDIINKKAIYLNQLVTELLEYSRYDMGNMRLNLKEFDIVELMREILSEYYDYFESNGLSLDIFLPEEHIYGNWDKVRLERAFRNIIDNAIKYGMDGKKLCISINHDSPRTKIVIKDYGMGMNEDELSNAFTKFYRSDRARNSKKGGMGLGLTVAYDIITKHGGTIELHSKEDNGLEVTIVL